MSVISISTAIPGPKSLALAERRQKAVTRGLSTAHPIFVASAKGVTVTDVDGNQLLDFAGGIGVLNVGHANPDVVAAAQKQTGELTHMAFQVAGYESYVAVCEALNRLAPTRGKEKRALLVSTGAEATENAVKIARYKTKRQAVLAFEHGFHGRTLLGMTMTGKASPYKAGFGPFAPEIYRLPFPYPYRGIDPGDLERALMTHVKPTDLAAVILEPVLGEGGFLAAPTAFAKALRAFCDKHGILIIADEVQSGFARTGTMFACEQIPLEPDLMTAAKSIAGGFPLAAVVGSAEVMDAVDPGGVGGTYAGNPVSCAAALSAIAVLEKLISSGRARAVGERIDSQLRKLAERFAIVGEVRGLGAMRAIELVTDRTTKEPATDATKKIVAAARDRGLLLLSAGTYGNVLRILVPLTATDAELDEGFAIMEKAFN